MRHLLVITISIASAGCCWNKKNVEFQNKLDGRCKSLQSCNALVSEAEANVEDCGVSWGPWKDHEFCKAQCSNADVQLSEAKELRFDYSKTACEGGDAKACRVAALSAIMAAREIKGSSTSATQRAAALHQLACKYGAKPACETARIYNNTVKQESKRWFRIPAWKFALCNSDTEECLSTCKESRCIELCEEMRKSCLTPPIETTPQTTVMAPKGNTKVLLRHTEDRPIEPSARPTPST